MGNEHIFRESAIYWAYNIGQVYFPYEMKDYPPLSIQKLFEVNQYVNITNSTPVTPDEMITTNNFVIFMDRISYYMIKNNINYLVDPIYLFSEFADNLNYVNNTFFETYIPIPSEAPTDRRGLFAFIVYPVIAGVIAAGLIGTSIAYQAKLSVQNADALNGISETPFYNPVTAPSRYNLKKEEINFDPNTNSTTTPSTSTNQTYPQSSQTFTKRSNENWKYI